MRNWEEKLQIAAGEDNVDELRTLAEEQLRVYRDNLPKPGTNQSAGTPNDSHLMTGAEGRKLAYRFYDFLHSKFKHLI